jgi:Concanavalin A-like lectin/glucanases superfamily
MAAFVNGTKKFFNMTAAPTGWTRDTATYDHAIVITSGQTQLTSLAPATNFTVIHPAPGTTTVTIGGTGAWVATPTNSVAQDIPSHSHTSASILRPTPLLGGIGTVGLGTTTTGSGLQTYWYGFNPLATPVTWFGGDDYISFAQDNSSLPSYPSNVKRPASGITGTVAGTKYTIQTLGTTTQAQFNAVAGTSGLTYNVGDKFTAVGTGAGSATVNADIPGDHFHTASVNGTSSVAAGIATNFGVRYVDLMIAIKNGAYGATWASQTATTVAKGGSVSITWNTPTTTVGAIGTPLFWTIVNSGETGALSSNALSGTFNTTGGTFVQAITIPDNSVWDNGGAFIVQLRSDSINGIIMAVSQQVTITETAPTATFTVTPTSITEGNTGTFTFTSTRLKNGEILTYTVNNTTSSNADFSSATGSVVVTSNTGTFTINPIIDLLIEGTETFTVSLITSSGLTLATSTSVNITDVPPTATFTVTPTTINVYNTGTFTITTTNVPNGTGLTWQVSGGANYQGTYVNSTGTVYIYNNTGTFYITPNSVRDIYKAYLVSNWTFGVIITNSAAQTLQTSSLVTVNNSTVVFATPTTSFNQGQTVRYNITTTNIPNGTQLVWKIANTIGNDACFSAVQGYVTINNNTGSFTISATRNNTFASLAWTTHTIDVYDFAGTFKLTGSGVGVTPVTYGVSITVYQNYPADAYTFITPPISILEGQAATLQFISTTNTGTITWGINNITTSAADFTGSVVSGTITLNGTTIIDNTSLNQQYLQTFTITTAALDTIAESTETFTVSLSTAIGVVATSNTISIIDVQSKYYFVNPATYINEGSITTYTVNSVNTTLTTLYWGITNITTVPGNFSGATNGSITLTAGSGTFSITTTTDAVSSGDKSFTINVTDGVNTVAVISPVVLVDSSKSPTYTFSLLPSSMSEGVVSTINFQTTGVASGTYYWTLNNASTVNADFTNLSGSFTTTGTISITTGSFTISPIADSLTEGFEFFTISVRTTSTTGPIVATSNIISITDTSFNPTYAFAVPTTTSINEGASISYTVNMTDVPIGTTLYWTIAPTVTTPTSSADFTAVSGSFLNSSGTASSSSGTFTITALADSLTEGNETFNLEIRIGSITGTVVLVSPTITVVDTSFNPTYAFSVPATSINEGTVTTYTLNTTDVPIGTSLYYTIESISTSTADFSSIVASSVYFPGNGYLTPPNNATFGLGTSDFTIECWVYTTTTNNNVIFDNRIDSKGNDTAGSGFDFFLSGVLRFGTAASFYISGTTSFSANTWYHVALSRYTVAGVTSTKMFLNGTQEGSTVTGITNFVNTATRIGFGLNGYLTGYISNLRVVKGIGLYSNNFTPVGPLNNTAQTILLTCKGPTVNSDNSSYSWNISTTGTTPTVVTTVSPSFTTSASSFVINNGTLASGSGSFTINAISDSLTEGNETFTLNVRIGSSNGTIVATVPTITIVDTSLTSSLAFASPTISINEGVAATYTVNSVNYPIGAPLFWNINHITTSVNDFLDPLTYNNSVGFGGAGGLSIASSSNLALGTGDWTIEAWIYPNNVTTAQNIIIDWRTANNSQPVLYLANNAVIWKVNSATKISGGTIVANTWQHIALVKNNYNVYLYINGVYQGYTGDTVTYATDATVQIGKAQDSNYWNGYITNLRVVKGVAVYNTGGSNFPVPTYQLNNIPRTILLACQGPTITSENSNGNYGSPWTINTVGTAPILSSTTIPFVGKPKATSGSFNISSGTLSSGSGTFSIPSPTLDLLTEGNETFSVRVGTVNTNSYNLLMGTTATPTYDAYGNPFTNTNGVTVSTNGSGYSLGFNGTNQYLAGPTGLPVITTGPFTIEAWIYATKFNAENCIVENAGWASGNNFGFRFILDNTGLVKLIGFYQWNVVDVILPSTVNVGLNYWSHVAVTRDSTDFVRMFINGVMCGTVTYSRTLSAFGTSSTPSPVGLRVGAEVADNNPGAYFAGSISNLRILNSVAVYTTDFSANLPSLTTPLLSTGTYIDSPTITVTDISLSPTYTFSSPITSINEGTVTTYTLNTTNVPIGTKLYWKINHSTTSENDFSPLIAYNNSVSFTGSGYLSIANAGALALGSGDFTVECWCYTNTITASQTHIFDTRTSATATNNPNLYLTQATMRWLINGTSILTGTIPLTTWTHVAVVKNSGIITMYINGNSTSSVADTVNYGIAQFQIGKAQDANYWNGYITNFRMVKGVAVYTTLFTPSIYQLTNITGTLLLACQGPTVITDNSTGNGGVPWTITTAGTTPPTLSASNVVNFVSRGTSGEFTVSSGTLSSGSGSFLITPLTDSLTEGNETFTIEIRTGSVTGSIITTSPTITIPANIT